MRSVLSVFGGLLLLAFAAPVCAKEYGQRGAVFAISEPDLLKVIEDRLRVLEKNGDIERMNQELLAKTRKKVNRPDPVPGVGLATRPRVWTFDPSMVIDHDVSDTKGNLIARKGQRVNPLDTVTISQALVFIDGDDPDQVSWALRNYTALNAKLIMVKGAPLEAMTKHQRRFYFDQGGSLIDRFGIRFVPAVVQQDGRVMKVREIPVSVQRGS